MKRLIDADDMIKSLMDMTFYDEEGYTIDDFEDRLAIVKSFVDSVPTIDTEPRWIPVSERLLEALEEVLVTSKYGHVYTSRIVHGEFEYGGEVIAWMPLPKPYEVKE